MIFWPARSVASSVRARRNNRLGSRSTGKAPKLLKLSRSNVYHLPRPVSEADLLLMRRIEALHLKFPFAVARMLRDMLKR